MSQNNLNKAKNGSALTIRLPLNTSPNLTSRRNKPPEAGKSKRGQGYSDEFKVRCLVLLKANNYHLEKTSEQCGVTARSLAQWRDKIGAKVFNEDQRQTPAILKSQLTEIVRKSKEELGHVTSEIFELALDAEKKLIERIKDLAETSNDLDACAKALTAIHKITVPVNGQEDGDNSGLKPQNTYIQLIMNSVMKVEEDIKWKIKQDQ